MIRSTNDGEWYDRIFRKEKKKTDTEKMIIWVCRDCGDSGKYKGSCELTIIGENEGKPRYCPLGSGVCNWQKKEER